MSIRDEIEALREELDLVLDYLERKGLLQDYEDWKAEEEGGEDEDD